MASFKKKSTGWEFRLHYKDVIENKFKEKSGSGFATKKEAIEAANKWSERLKNVYNNEKISLVDYLEWWLNNHKNTKISKNTRISYKNAIDTHIKPHFKKIILTNLDAIMYQEFLNKLTNKEFSRSTIEKAHSVMYGAMKQAIKQGRIEKNPCDGAVIHSKTSDDTIKYIESDDISKFIQEAKRDDYMYYLFFKMLIETGMRKGEAAALQWTDVDMKDRTISINKTLDFSAKVNEPLFGETKTSNSKRIITISQSLINDLRYQMSIQNQNKLAYGELYRHDINLINCKQNGDPLPKSSLFNSFRRILRKAGLNNISIHSLRHTHVVLLMEAGADIKYIQERLGHGSIQITSDVYAHVSKKINAINTERYENLIKDIF